MLNVKTTRLTSADNIKASQGRLAWIAVSCWDSAASYVILNDATSGTGTAVVKLYAGPSRTEVFNFIPPICFNTGIRVGTFGTANMEVTGGYD